MIRLIKRYGSRKLYDTEESRYVLLDDVAAWIRQGQQVRVIDNKTAEDVTAQTLTQIISEEGRRGSGLPNDMLHELIRFGQDAVNTGVARLQSGVDRFVQASIDRLAPVRRAREEMEALRKRLEELEVSLVQMEVQREVSVREAGPRRAPATKGEGPGRRASKVTAAKKANDTGRAKAARPPKSAQGGDA